MFLMLLNDFEKMKHEKSPFINYNAFCKEMVGDIRKEEKEKEK
jgi:hypothetical protein